MILIKDTIIIDGTGNPRKQGDILIKEGVIAAMGKLSNQKADLVISGKSLVATPGFIDINTDSDHYLSLFSDPFQENFVLQGVTTIIGGHSGASLAPLVRGDLRSIRKWADINTVNVDWQTVQEFLDTLKKIKVGVNFGTLVGHATIRRGLIGEENRHLTKKELEAFKDLLESSLKEGAFGFSTGLRYNHAKYAPYEEISELVKIVAKQGGLYASHLRNEQEDIADAVDEIIGYARETGAKTLITHLRAMKGFENQFNQAFEHIERAAKEINLQFDGYPFDYSIVPLYTLLPKPFLQGNLESMYEAVCDPDLEKEITDQFPRFGGDDLIVAQAQGFDYLVGKTIGEFAKNNEMPIKKALIKLMQNTKLKAVVFQKNINLDQTVKALFSDNGFIASNSPSRVGQKSTMTNERAATTFTRFLELVLSATGPQKPSGGRYTLEWAIHKITGKPASFLGLKKRGILKEGNMADITLLRGAQAEHVFIGGVHRVHNGQLTENPLSGSILKK